MLIALAIIFFFYSILLLYFWVSWNAIPKFQDGNGSSGISFSVIIPARNEEANIGTLLEALEKQTYPKSLTEIIVIDDHSTDRTAAIVSGFQSIKLLRLANDGINSYKKEAIATGIASASGDWIICTDADCIPMSSWLETFAGVIEKSGAVLIAAPVRIDCNGSILQLFQAMDFIVLQGITGAAVYKKMLSMSNGANLAYEKKAFHAVNGFKGIDDIASGDDMLLMHKIAQHYPGRIQYLKAEKSIVSTQAAKSWKEFFQQRIRWASKATRYEDKRITVVLLLVYLVNLSFPILIIAGFWNHTYWIAALVFLMIKTLVELPLFSTAARFFNRQWMIGLFLLFQPLHIIYTIISGLFGQFGSYEWKGRKVH